MGNAYAFDGAIARQYLREAYAERFSIENNTPLLHMHMCVCMCVCI